MDFNPDKERHVPRKFLVQPSSKLPNQKSVTTEDGRELKFDKFSRMSISDEGLARELQSEYKQDIVVSRMRLPESGHGYFWGSWPEMPWKNKTKERK